MNRITASALIGAGALLFAGALCAIDWMGQCPWHNWTVYPPGPGLTDVAKPRLPRASDSAWTRTSMGASLGTAGRSSASS